MAVGVLINSTPLNPRALKSATNKRKQNKVGAPHEWNRRMDEGWQRQKVPYSRPTVSPAPKGPGASQD